jgi:hypothetical protein
MYGTEKVAKSSWGANSVVNYEVVLANGTVCAANAQQNSDLYWALKEIRDTTTKQKARHSDLSKASTGNGKTVFGKHFVN